MGLQAGQGAVFAHLHDLETNGTHVQAYKSDVAGRSEWRFRYVTVRPGERYVLGADVGEHDVVGYDADAAIASAREREAERFRQSVVGRWIRGELGDEYMFRGTMGSPEPSAGLDMSAFAWIPREELPAGCPYPFPFLPVPQEDYATGRWLEPDYTPSRALPSPYADVRWRCGVTGSNPTQERGKKGEPPPPRPGAQLPGWLMHLVGLRARFDHETEQAISEDEAVLALRDEMDRLLAALDDTTDLMEAIALQEEIEGLVPKLHRAENEAASAFNQQREQKKRDEAERFRRLAKATANPERKAEYEKNAVEAERWAQYSHEVSRYASREVSGVRQPPGKRAVVSNPPYARDPFAGLTPWQIEILLKDAANQGEMAKIESLEVEIAQVLEMLRSAGGDLTARASLEQTLAGLESELRTAFDNLEAGAVALVDPAAAADEAEKFPAHRLDAYEWDLEQDAWIEGVGETDGAGAPHQVLPVGGAPSDVGVAVGTESEKKHPEAGDADHGSEHAPEGVQPSTSVAPKPTETDPIPSSSVPTTRREDGPRPSELPAPGQGPAGVSRQPCADIITASELELELNHLIAQVHEQFELAAGDKDRRARAARSGQQEQQELLDREQYAHSGTKSGHYTSPTRIRKPDGLMGDYPTVGEVVVGGGEWRFDVTGALKWVNDAYEGALAEIAQFAFDALVSLLEEVLSPPCFELFMSFMQKFIGVAADAAAWIDNFINEVGNFLGSVLNLGVEVGELAKELIRTASNFWPGGPKVLLKAISQVKLAGVLPVAILPTPKGVKPLRRPGRRVRTDRGIALAYVTDPSNTRRKYPVLDTDLDGKPVLLGKVEFTRRRRPKKGGDGYEEYGEKEWVFVKEPGVMVDRGHADGYSHVAWARSAEQHGITQKEFNAVMTDPDKYRLELAKVNRTRAKDNFKKSWDSAEQFWSEFVANGRQVPLGPR